MHVWLHPILKFMGQKINSNGWTTHMFYTDGRFFFTVFCRVTHFEIYTHRMNLKFHIRQNKS